MPVVSRARVRARAREVCALAWIATASVACGYRLQGTGTFLPPGIKTVCVPIFKNETTRFELDVRFTQSVIQEVTARGKVRTVSDPEAADAVLTGEILSFQVTPVAFREGSADRYTITVVARVVLRERAGQKVLFQAPSFVFTEPYEVPAESDFESVESEAIAKVADKFARSLVLNILEGF